MASFEDTGIREELLHTLEDEDIVTPTALQESVIPALRRGGNVVARASAGAGRTIAYTLGVLDRLETDRPRTEEDDDDAPPALRFLVLTPTVEEAERAADTVTPYAQALELSLAVAGAGWGTPVAEAAILFGTPADLLLRVQGSRVKLDSVEAVVVDGAAAMVELDEWEHVDELLDIVPRDAQRVLISPSLPLPVEELIERRVKRALRYPAGAAAAAAREESGDAGQSLGYVLVPEPQKFALLAAQLGGGETGGPPPVIFCRSDERAADLAEKLAQRGFLVGEPADTDADVALVVTGVTRAALLETSDGEVGQSISYDIPADTEMLRARHAGDANAVVLLAPRELPHLRAIAQQAGLSPTAVAMTREISGSAATVEQFRHRIRRAIRDEDIGAQMLVLEPLFEEFAAAEVAAAVTALLRRRTPAPAPAAPEAAVAPAPERPAEAKSAPAGPAPVTWTRLFVSIGSKEEIRPGDLVGTLAGEAEIPGSKIGKIEIRDAFSIVEVQSDVAEKVIRAVNGTTVKGRSVRVDFDRGGPERRPAPRRGSPPARRTTRRPPRD